MNLVIPTALRKHCDGRKQIESTASTVGDALEGIAKDYPELHAALIGPDGDVASHINLFVNDQNVRDLSGLQTVAGERDELLIVSALAGG
ncbi:MoaD/ThiS family protein [Crateriforma conspicua]|uniref:MoaD/ThiS family protein n=1 Tax=Crateriforma conspicua TaxID=2527996 RepID=UPI00118991F2|nr:MoaD/ThiS family protein [Crateriforma conspicua]QDV65636.1 Sulfur carrier protein CysO [Crateriforma conspicua]